MDNMKSFNSMIVRLKEQEANINSGMVNEFQFYDSPIKSRKTSGM